LADEANGFPPVGANGLPPARLAPGAGVKRLGVWPGAGACVGAGAVVVGPNEKPGAAAAPAGALVLIGVGTVVAAGPKEKPLGF